MIGRGGRRPLSASCATGRRPVILSLILAGVSFLPANAQTTQSICDRTAAVRDKILSESGAADCAAVTSSQLASVSRLPLANSGIASLKSGDFAGLTGLTRLELYGNTLDSLPSDVFSGLSSLAVLQMSYNSLDALPSDVFSGLTSLQELNVSHNELTALPSGVFSDLSSLLFLYLDGNDIAALPAGIFAGAPLVQLLFLYGNNFTTFPANTFTALDSLSWLTLEGGALTSLPAGAFSGLAKLKQLDLSNNSLASIPGDAFSGATAIERLLLSGNSLGSLPDSVFEGLSGLDRALWLQDNNVDPMPIVVSLVATSDTAFKAKAHTGAPFAIQVPLSVTNGTLGASTVTIPAGAIESSEVTVTPSADAQGTVTVDVGTLPGLPDLGTYTHYWGDEHPAHHGYELERSADLPLALHRADTAALWSSTLTVEERDGFRGYSRIAHPDAGAVSDYKFEYGSGTPYEVQIVVAYADGVVFQVRNRGESLSDLTLEWAGETLPLSAATHDDDRFTWHPTWLNANAASLNASTYATTLPDGGTGTVCLRTSDQTCPSTTVTAPASTPAPLTAEFQDVPESHDGSTAFTVEIVFNEEPAGMNNQHLRRVLQVTGGDIRTVRRVNRDRAHRIVGIAPDTTEAVRIVLPATTDCAAVDALCTADGGLFANGIETLVQGPASASADDIGGPASPEEDDDPTLLRLLERVSPQAAAAALLGEGDLKEAQLTALDRLGNGNGRFDLGDVLSWRDRCRRGEADCGGGGSGDAGPAGAAALLAAGRARGRGRGTSGLGTAREAVRPGLADALGRAVRVAAPSTRWACYSPRSRPGRAGTARWGSGRRPPPCRIRASSPWSSPRRPPIATPASCSNSKAPASKPCGLPASRCTSPEPPGGARSSWRAPSRRAP